MLIYRLIWCGSGLFNRMDLTFICDRSHFSSYDSITSLFLLQQFIVLLNSFGTVRSSKERQVDINKVIYFKPGKESKNFVL